MTDKQKTESQGRDTDEIDIIELLLQLWRGKWVLLLCLLLGIGVAGGLLFFPAKWSSTATITRPDSAQIALYTHAVNVLEGGNTANTLETETRLVNRFAMAFSALSAVLNNQSHPEKLSIEPVAKNESLPLKLSYQANSAEMAQAKLAEYVVLTNKKIVRDLEIDLQESIQQKVAVLTASLATQEQITQEQKDLRIEQIKEALKFAEAAGITQPQERIGTNTTQDTLFLLGSEALQSMVDRESMRPLALPESYFQTRQQLLDIEQLNISPLDISTYRYVLKPTLPIYKESPRIALLLVLGALLGMMVGCAGILGRNAFREYKRTHL